MHTGCVRTFLLVLSLIFILVIPASAGFEGYLDLLTVDEFNKKTPEPNPQYMQFDFEEAQAAGLAAEGEYYGEKGMVPPPGYFIETGNLLVSQKRYKDAEETFETALNGDPRNIDAIIGLGMVTFGLGSYPFAASQFDDAIRLDARNTLAWTYKAVSQANAGNLKDAVTSIGKATTYGPSDALAWYYAAAIYAEQGDMNLAEEAIEKARNLKPDNSYVQTLYREIAPQDSAVKGEPAGKSTETADSRSNVTDITDSLKSNSFLYGVGEIISAEVEKKGSGTVLRYSVRDEMDSGIPVEYHVVLKADPAEGKAPLAVEFSDESYATGGVNPVMWTWKINREKFTGKSISHTFPSPGTTAVNWEIRWSDGKVSTSTVQTALEITVLGEETEAGDSLTDSDHVPTMM